MRLSDLASMLGLEVEGDASVEVTRAASIDDATEGDITYARDAAYAAKVATTRASAVVAPPGPPAGRAAVLRTKDVDLVFLRAIHILHPRPKAPPGVHPTAIVPKSTRLGEGTSIGPYVVVEEDVEIGARCEIRAHCVLHRGVRIGDDCRLHSRVVVREGCRIGRRAIVQDGVVIGADGFGFAKQANGSYVKIPQVGVVVIEDDVEVQANSCIDRAMLGETRIGRGTKIDNLVQVGHNCIIGDDSILCGQVGLGGSTTLGKGVLLGGQVGVAGHLKLGDGSGMLAQSGLTTDIPAGEVFAGTPAIPVITNHRFAVSIPRFIELLSSARALERRVKALESEKKPGLEQK